MLGVFGFCLFSVFSLQFDPAPRRGEPHVTRRTPGQHFAVLPAHSVQLPRFGCPLCGFSAPTDMTRGSWFVVFSVSRLFPVISRASVEDKADKDLVPETSLILLACCNRHTHTTHTFSPHLSRVTISHTNKEPSYRFLAACCLVRVLCARTVTSSVVGKHGGLSRSKQRKCVSRASVLLSEPSWSRVA